MSGVRMLRYGDRGIAQQAEGGKPAATDAVFHLLITSLQWARRLSFTICRTRASGGREHTNSARPDRHVHSLKSRNVAGCVRKALKEVSQGAGAGFYMSGHVCVRSIPDLIQNTA